MTNTKTNKFTKTLKTNQTKQVEYFKFKINKNDIIGESEYSILFKLSDEDKCWISKKIVFTSEYTNWLTITPASNSSFKCLSKTGEYELRAEQLKRIVEEMYGED